MVVVNFDLLVIVGKLIFSYNVIERYLMFIVCICVFVGMFLLVLVIGLVVFGVVIGIVNVVLIY